MIPSKTRRPKYGLLVDSNVIKESIDVELLRLIIDNKPMFEKHIAKLCQTASRHSPCTQTNKKILKLEKNLVLKNDFVDSQFNFAMFLIWMFCKKNIYLRCEKFTIKHSFIDESYKNLLILGKRVPLHQWHLRFLVTEIFKSVPKTNSEFMWFCFGY